MSTSTAAPRATPALISPSYLILRTITLALAVLVGAAVLGGWTGVVLVAVVGSVALSTWVQLYTSAGIGD